MTGCTAEMSHMRGFEAGKEDTPLQLGCHLQFFTVGIMNATTVS